MYKAAQLYETEVSNVGALKSSLIVWFQSEQRRKLIAKVEVMRSISSISFEKQGSVNKYRTELVKNIRRFWVARNNKNGEDQRSTLALVR